MNKLYFNKNGYICNRHPYMFECEDPSTQFIEVDDEILENTLCVPEYYIWAIRDGMLQIIPYELDKIEKEE